MLHSVSSLSWWLSSICLFDFIFMLTDPSIFWRLSPLSSSLRFIVCYSQWTLHLLCFHSCHVFWIYLLDYLLDFVVVGVTKFQKFRSSRPWLYFLCDIKYIQFLLYILVSFNICGIITCYWPVYLFVLLCYTSYKTYVVCFLNLSFVIAYLATKVIRVFNLFSFVLTGWFFSSESYFCFNFMLYSVEI